MPRSGAGRHIHPVKEYLSFRLEFSSVDLQSERQIFFYRIHYGSRRKPASLWLTVLLLGVTTLNTRFHPASLFDQLCLFSIHAFFILSDILRLLIGSELSPCNIMAPCNVVNKVEKRRFEICSYQFVFCGADRVASRQRLIHGVG